MTCRYLVASRNRNQTIKKRFRLYLLVPQEKTLNKTKTSNSLFYGIASHKTILAGIPIVLLGLGKQSTKHLFFNDISMIT